MVVFGATPMLFWGVFSCFAEASLSLRSLRDYETTSLQVYKCYRRGFANASQLKGRESRESD